MSIDLKHGRYCDECGRTIQKAKRVFEGKDYCSSCYPIVFVKSVCTSCGGSARMHRFSKNTPLCSLCTRIGRVCARCEKPVLKAGLIYSGKAICPSCVPHFRAQLACSSCGCLSTRLSAMPSMGIEDKICDSCRNKFTHKTCCVCRKFRKVEFISEKNRPFCASCVPGKELSHSCPDCNMEVQGNGFSRCRACLNWNQISHEANMFQHVLTREWAKNIFLGFGNWFHQRDPAKPNLVKNFRNHQLFFERLDATFISLDEINSKSLLQFFGTAVLRKHLIVMQYFSEEIGIELSKEAKLDSAERGRIGNILQQSKKFSWNKILEHYSNWLEQSGAAVRTHRLYLSSAASFCKHANLSNQPWTEDIIRQFLQQNPGLRANLFKFVGYCKRSYGWDVYVPPRSENANLDAVTKTVSDLRKLFLKVAKEGVDFVDKGTLARIISKSFGFPLKDLMNLSPDQFRNGHEGLVFNFMNESILVPSGLEEIVSVYIRRLSP
ncbi:uncharacterized protein YacL (UPF0231 family) [Undibacterium sp. GrIS 1.8]|uniref:hypothetical protein n=1 Tax=Undibacterium sp. GrIS 1.8 TaxID=3143934 RepID=UPI00339162EF